MANDQPVTEHFSDKISYLIWTQIKENEKQYENEALYYISLHVLCGMSLV